MMVQATLQTSKSQNMNLHPSKCPNIDPKPTIQQGLACKLVIYLPAVASPLPVAFFWGVLNRHRLVDGCTFHLQPGTTRPRQISGVSQSNQAIETGWKPPLFGFYWYNWLV